MYKWALRKAISLVILFLVFTVAITTIVNARSGCCSYHSGVRADGCGCNDGSSLSSTCAPYYSCTRYNPPIYIPQPTPITIPTYINGSSTYYYNNSTKSYNVSFNWDDWSSSSGWSVGISSYAGADPGPNIDTTTSNWTFENVYPGRKYINMKGSVNGYWSRVSYWTIDVPPIPTSTPVPTITPTPTITLVPTITPSPPITPIIENKSIFNRFWQWLSNRQKKKLI